MWRTLYARVTAVAAVVMLASMISVGVEVWRLRDDAIAEATKSAGSIATILGEQTSHSVQSIELMLDELVDNISRSNIRNQDEYRQHVETLDFHGYLKDRLSRLPQADAITYVSASGEMLGTTRGWPHPEADLSDRDFFQYALKSGNADGLDKPFISEPATSKVTGEWTIFFGRALRSANGNFLGVAVVGVRPEFLIRTFDVITSVPGRSLTLTRQDGVVLLRRPNQGMQPGDKIPSGSDWYQTVRNGGGAYRSIGARNPEPRWVAVRPVPRYPLALSIKIMEANALADWKTRATTIAVCTFVIELAFALLLLALYRQFERLHVSKAHLAEKSKELALAKGHIDAAFSHMSHGIAMYDPEGRLIVHNRQYEQIWGLSADDLSGGKSLTDILTMRAQRDVYADPTTATTIASLPCNTPKRFNRIRQLKNGRSILVTFDTMPQGGWVTTHEDITERQRATARIAHMAHHDALTDLANRSLFVTTLQERLNASSEHEHAVLLVDLDHFKEVNDSFGHGVGDALLQQVAERLKQSTRDADLVARLGGDEFAILHQMDNSGTEGLLVLAERLLANTRVSYEIDGHDICIGLSIGIAQTKDCFDPEKVMRRADLALYRSKSQGRNAFRLFEQAMEDQVQSRRELALDLQGAMSRNELQVFYQPIVHAQTREIRTMEALLRWSHPLRGMVPPDQFIGLAEEAGLIYRLGEWVLRRACLDALNWPDHVKIAVNVSALQVAQMAFPDTVARVLCDTGFPARRLELEITESVLLSDGNRALAVLHALRNLGLSVVLDDFGTGYSSLSYLKMFPFDEIKIDKSFIDDLTVHRGCEAIVSATTALATAFGIITTAEGVETQEQYDILRAASVTQMQGYLFGRPAPAVTWVFEQQDTERAIA